MATLLSPNQVKLNDGTVKSTKQGEWYDGSRFLDGRLLGAGEYEPGKMTSNEVIAQTNPKNVGYIQQQVRADTIQAPVQIPYLSGSNPTEGMSLQVELANKRLKEVLAAQTQQNQKQVEMAKLNQTQGLENLKTTAVGIRQDVENFSSKYDATISQDFDERRKTVGRLEQLLVEGQEYIRQQKEVTGLASVRNPRINKSIEDVNAESSVLQAYISGLDGNISQAHNIINNKMGEILTSRQEELNYYKTIIQLSENEILRLDGDQKRIASAEIANAETFLNSAIQVSDHIKQLLVNPSTAPLMDGVRLNMSIEEINQTISNNAYSKEVREVSNSFAMDGATPVLDPSGIPSDQLRVYTDPRGIQHYYKLKQQPQPPRYSTNTQANSFLDPSVPTPNTGTQQKIQTQSAITKVDPQTYNILYDIGRDVLTSGSSARINK